MSGGVAHDGGTPAHVAPVDRRPLRLRREAWGFAIGSVCFFLGALPWYADWLGAVGANLTFFIGSIFFTLGGLHPVEPERPNGTTRPDEPRRSRRLVGGRHPVRRHAPLQHLDRCRARRGDRPTRCRGHRLATRRVGVPRVPRVELSRGGRDQGSRSALGRARAHLARHVAEPRGVGRVRRLGGRRLRHARDRRLRERALGEPRHGARCGLLLHRGLLSRRPITRRARRRSTDAASGHPAA